MLTKKLVYTFVIHTHTLMNSRNGSISASDHQSNVRGKMWLSAHSCGIPHNKDFFLVAFVVAKMTERVQIECDILEVVGCATTWQCGGNDVHAWLRTKYYFLRGAAKLNAIFNAHIFKRFRCAAAAGKNMRWCAFLLCKVYNHDAYKEGGVCGVCGWLEQIQMVYF